MSSQFRFKQLWFKHYWWVVLIVALLAVIAVSLIYKAGQRAAPIESILAAVLGLCYFTQQQRLAEIRWFKELFTEFNHRYDNLHTRLQEISKPEKPRSETDSETIIEYFNLCGEEYLFFKEGYIHPQVWTAWCSGMLWYFEREPFRTRWKDEEPKNSYYGLSVDVIRRGAVC